MMEKQVKMIKGTEHTEEFVQKKLDRPDREKLLKLITPYIDDEWHGEGYPVKAELIVDDVLALFPDIEEAKTQAIRQTVDYLKMHYCIVAPEARIKEIEEHILKEKK